MAAFCETDSREELSLRTDCVSKVPRILLDSNTPNARLDAGNGTGGRAHVGVDQQPAALIQNPVEEGRRRFCAEMAGTNCTALHPDPLSPLGHSPPN